MVPAASADAAPWHGKRNRSRRLRVLVPSRLQVPPGRTLQAASVTQKTRDTYNQHVGEFLRQHPELDLLQITDQALDQTANDYVHQLFFDGCGVSQAKSVVYGLLWRRSAKIHSMPVTRHALAGFANQDPSQIRDPATWSVTCLIAKHAATFYKDGPYLAAFRLLTFDSYSRVGEMMRATAEWLVPPKVAGEQIWAMIFFPSCSAEMSKTKQQDDTVILAQSAERRWLNTVVSTLWRRSFPKKRLFNLTYYQVRQACQQGHADLKLKGGTMCPHRLRHGGASLDALSGKPRSYIKHRGRWQSTKSVDRYMKHGRYLRMLGLLSDQQRHDAHLAEKWLKKNLVKLLAN